MRLLAWTAIASVVLALVLGFIARASDVGALDMVAGMLWLVALVAGIALLPFWRRIIPRVEPMPGLFVRPGATERWCALCGSVAQEDDACAVCGGEPRRREPRRQNKA